MHKEFICIGCPKGCRLTIEDTSKGYKVEGNTCEKGKVYAIQEMNDPRRIITSTVKIENGFLALLPVKTAMSIPKNLIFDVMKEINKVTVKAPVKLGDVLIENVCFTGIDVIATRDMGEEKIIIEK